MLLELSIRGEAIGKYFWRCSKYPECKHTKDYNYPKSRFDFANDDFLSTLNSIDEKSDPERQEILNEITVQMPQILEHFIKCSWGAHYNTMFEKIIKPHLTDPLTLDFVLNGDCIKEYKGNVIRGKTGAKIYQELFIYLKRVESRPIQEYLENEFEERLKQPS